MTPPQSLSRTISLGPAILIGLGSILGTGVYVGLGLAAGAAGDWIFLAILIAAALALCNGLSSAQLAAVMPISGGTYEYGYRLLGGIPGFTAGWLFLCAKSASAAAAAIAASGMLLVVAGMEPTASGGILGMLIILVMTLVVGFGMRTSTRTNAILVAVAVGGLLLFMLSSLARSTGLTRSTFNIDIGSYEAQSMIDSASNVQHTSVAGIALASALVFVGFTGYGRIATLGEEVRSPRRTIPIALVLALGVATILYLLITSSVLGVATPGQYGFLSKESAAPLVLIAKAMHGNLFAFAITIGGLCALFAILLNLLLGLSRVVLAMARRGDMPARFARLSPGGDSPTAAVIGVGALLLVLVAFLDLRAAWTFSALTVVIYYAITNIAALKVPAEKRFIPKAVSVMGLAGCCFLAVFIPWAMWLTACLMLVVGWIWWLVCRRIGTRFDQLG